MALTRRFVDTPIIPAFGDRDPRHAADTNPDARMWLNIGTIVGTAPVDPTLMARIVELGAVGVRFGASWQQVEDYDTGNLTWPVGFLSALAWLRDNAPWIQVLSPVTYEPPWKQVDTLTLTANTTGDSTQFTINVTSANGLTNLVPQLDLVTVKNQSGAARTVGLRRGYAGGLIDSINPTAGTITLASAVAPAVDSKGNPQAYGPLTTGMQLIVNRQKFPAIGADNADPNGASPQAFIRQVQATADLIASYGLSGYVALMNEPPWSASPWASGINRYYDSFPDINPDNPDPGMIPILRAAMQMTTLPNDPPVRLCSDATDKSQRPDITGSVMAPYLAMDNVTDAKIRATITMQSRHPYSVVQPTTALWDPAVTLGNKLEALDLTSASTFPNMPYNAATFRAAGHPAPMLAATEWGYTIDADSGVNDQVQAKYSVAGQIARWGCGVIPCIYTLQTFKDGGASVGGYSLLNVDGSPRQVFTALKRLMTAVTGLGKGFNGAAVMPTVVGWKYSDTNRLTVVGVYGGLGACLFLFQHPQPVVSATTGNPANYSTVALPARVVPIALPFSADPEEVTVISTGAAATWSRSGNLLTVLVTEDPVMVRVALTPGSAPSPGTFTAVNNGDGTATFYGTSVVDNGDGSFTISDLDVTVNGDGTFTAAT